MERERDVLVSPTVEVPVIEGEVVTAIRTLADRGVGEKTIAREVGVARNVVQRLLAERGLTVSVRTLERAVADILLDGRAGSRRWRPCASKRRRVAGTGSPLPSRIFGGVPRTLLGDNARPLASMTLRGPSRPISISSMASCGRRSIQRTPD